MTPTKKKRTFILLDRRDKDTEKQYMGTAARQAALKATSAKAPKTGREVEIRLREAGAKKVNIYTGWVKVIDAPDNSPEWLPKKVKQAFVKKLGILHLDKLKTVD